MDHESPAEPAYRLTITDTANEQEARRRGCRYPQLTTYSFQAREFYAKLGYSVVGQVDDHPPGSSYFCMWKDFEPA